MESSSQVVSFIKNIIQNNTLVDITLISSKIYKKAIVEKIEICNIRIEEQEHDNDQCSNAYLHFQYTEQLYISFKLQTGFNNGITNHYEKVPLSLISNIWEYT